MKSKKKQEKENRTLSKLPDVERRGYFVVTVLTVAYMCYCVFRDSIKYDGILNLYDFKPGWWILGGQEQDISNFEWNFWYAMFWRIGPWYLGHFALGRLVLLHCSKYRKYAFTVYSALSVSCLVGWRPAALMGIHSIILYLVFSTAKPLVYRKYVFTVYSALSVSCLVGWRPAALMGIHSIILYLVSSTAKPLVVWVTSLGLLSTLNFEPFISYMKQLVEDDEEENWYYLLMFTLALTNIKATSFCLERCTDLKETKNRPTKEDVGVESLYKQLSPDSDASQITSKDETSQSDEFEYTIMDLLCYIYYLPLFFTGPILTYNLFRQQINAPAPGMTLPRLKYLGLNIFRFIFWAVFNEFILHFVYFNALQHNLTVLRSVSLFTLAGIGYSHGQFFMVKYHVMFGLPASVARLDNLDPPSGPKCITYIYLYSDMWKYFDRGLYSFLKRYIYVPCGGSQAGVHRQIIGSILCFMYIFYWHGAQDYILWWILLNYLGVSLEKLGDVIISIPTVRHLETEVLSPAMVQRVHAFCSIPIFLLSCFSMFCFFGGQTVCYIFFQRLILEGWPGSWITLIFLLYCAIQNAIEVNKWVDRRTDKKYL